MLGGLPRLLPAVSLPSRGSRRGHVPHPHGLVLPTSTRLLLRRRLLLLRRADCGLLWLQRATWRVGQGTVLPTSRLLRLRRLLLLLRRADCGLLWLRRAMRRVGPTRRGGAPLPYDIVLPASRFLLRLWLLLPRRGIQDWSGGAVCTR